MRTLDATSCLGPGAVDVFISDDPHNVLHVNADEWAAFAAAVKAGKYDRLIPPELSGPGR